MLVKNKKDFLKTCSNSMFAFFKLCFESELINVTFLVVFESEIINVTFFC